MSEDRESDVRQAFAEARSRAEERESFDRSQAPSNASKRFAYPSALGVNLEQQAQGLREAN